MANEINYSDAITNILLQSFLKGNGGGTTTTTTSGGQLPAEVLAALQGSVAGLGGGLGQAADVVAPDVPQVSAEITPAQLAAIFQQGATEIPNLTAAFANAAGARSSNNSGLKLALNTLNESLVREAAKLSQSQQALSTDAAVKGGQLKMQAGQINSNNFNAFMQAQAQMMAEQMRAETAIAGYQRQPQTQVSVQNPSGDVDPSKLLLGGLALNMADKAGVGKKVSSWWDKLYGDQQDAAPVSDSIGSTVDNMVLPTQDYSMLGGMSPAPQIDYLGEAMGAPQSYAMPQIDYTMPSYEIPSFNIGSYDYNMPSYDFGGGFDLNSDFSGISDWGGFSGFDWSSSDVGGIDGWMDDGSSWLGFADGGQPVRKFQAAKYLMPGYYFADGGQPMRRNQADMGAAPTRRVTGAQNRELPAEYRGLVAPVNIQRPEAPEPPNMMAFAEMLQQMQAARQQQMDAQAAATKPQAGAANELMMPAVKEGGNDSMEGNTNMSFNPTLASAIKTGLGVAGMASVFGGAPILGAMGMMSPLANATTNDQATSAAAIGGIKLANPVLGFVAQQAAKYREAKAAEAAKQEAARVEAERQQAATAAPQQPSTPSGPAIDPNVQAAYGDPGTANIADYGSMWGNQSLGQQTDLGGELTGSPMSRAPTSMFGGFSLTGNGQGSDSGQGGPRGGTSFGGGEYKDGGQPAGGMIQGPGTGTSDSIPMPLASVSNGEYIMSADVVEAMGVDFFDKLQAAFHKGGKPA